MKLASLLASAILLGGLPSALALDKDAILAIVEKPHSRENLLPELAIFPDVRVLDLRVSMQVPGAASQQRPPFQGAMKIVEGRYYVAVYQPEDAGGIYRSVTTFDQEARVYRRWVLLPDGSVFTMTGTSAAGSRALSWIGILDARRSVLGVEQHTDEGTDWSDVYLDEGKVVQRWVGVGNKAK
jgi:hypothetical protein